MTLQITCKTNDSYQIVIILTGSCLRSNTLDFTNIVNFFDESVEYDNRLIAIIKHEHHIRDVTNALWSNAIYD